MDKNRGTAKKHAEGSKVSFVRKEYREGKYIVINEFETPLPKKEINTKDNYVDGIKAAFHSLMKRQVVNVISGNSKDFDIELINLIDHVKNHYYNLGLKHMDKMHGIIDQ